MSAPVTLADLWRAWAEAAEAAGAAWDASTQWMISDATGKLIGAEAIAADAYLRAVDDGYAPEHITTALHHHARAIVIAVAARARVRAAVTPPQVLVDMAGRAEAVVAAARRAHRTVADRQGAR